MAIAFSCQSCQKQYSVRDELAGKIVKCGQCQSRIVVPQYTQEAASPGVIQGNEVVVANAQNKLEMDSSLRDPFDFSPRVSNGIEAPPNSIISIDAIRQLPTFLNPLNDRHPFWLRGGLWSLYFLLPTMLIGMSISEGKGVAEAALLPLKFIPATIVLFGFWLLLISFRNIFLRFCGVVSALALTPVIIAIGLFYLIAFIPGGIVGYILGKIFHDPRTVGWLTKTSQSRTTQGSENVAGNSPARLQVLPAMMAVVTFFILGVILPIVGFQLTGVQVLSIAPLNLCVLAAAMLISSVVYSIMKPRKRLIGITTQKLENDVDTFLNDLSGGGSS